MGRQTDPRQPAGHRGPDARSGAADPPDATNNSSAWRGKPRWPHLILVKALGDLSLFARWAPRVRWRTGPVEDSVPALARLLRDSDLSVRLAAAATLSDLGPAAKAALSS